MSTSTIVKSVTRSVRKQAQALPASLNQAAGLLAHKTKALKRHVSTLRREWSAKSK